MTLFVTAEKWTQKTGFLGLFKFLIDVFFTARRAEIIRSTEMLLEAITTNDFESYA